MSEVDEYDELDALLRSWSVEEVLPYFRDEDINIKELHMMKRQHIADVLRNFRYGTRIRFEYHLERWRRWIHLPIEQGASTSAAMATAPAHCNGCRCAEAEIRSQSPAHRPPSEPMPMSLQQPADDLFDERPEPFNEEVMLAPTLSVREEFQMVKSETSIASNEDSSYVSDEIISVLHILKSTGARGQSLLDCRSRNVELQQSQRLLLIQLICSYYGDNNLHLSLQRSHLLEREILVLFPKERLESYRTERRGKIYVKFTNMKRFKRIDGREPRRRGTVCYVPKELPYMAHYRQSNS